MWSLQRISAASPVYVYGSVHVPWADFIATVAGFTSPVAMRLQGMLTPKAYQQAKTLLLTSAIAGAGIVMTLLTGYVMASPTFGWTGAAGSALTHRNQLNLIN